MTPQPGLKLARGLMLCTAAVAGVMILDGLMHLVDDAFDAFARFADDLHRFALTAS